jgi:signal transduction histidine kinase/CheY-like chemotaxis protein
MVQKSKSVKYKVVAGYLLLFAIAVVSVWFVYTEILKIAKPGQAEKDNGQVIRISNIIADLYASEALGRSSIATGSVKDYEAYNKLIDSINIEIEAVKNDVEEGRRAQFDSIKLLINRKKNSTAEIFKNRNDFAKSNTLGRAISGIYIIKDSIKEAVKPVRSTKRYQWNRIVNEVLSPRQRDSLSKLPVSNDSLAIAFDKALTVELYREKQAKKRILQKEEKLLEENRLISDKLRIALSEVENEFLTTSYTKIRAAQNAIAKTTETMAWVGAATFLLLIFFAAIIIRDLTSQQNYRRQLEVLNQENEELLRSKSMLMATVTHDLQTPLGSILGFHDLLKESGVSLKQKQYLSNIKESADYILALVNDLLDFSKLENDKIKIEQAPFNVRQLIENTCRTLEPIAINKGIELNWDIDEELNSNFLSDPYRIKQVLTNLVSNAVKFTHEGSVEVTGKISNDMICIAVIDTGIGIAKEKHNAVFKEFTQAHSGIGKKFGGSGLGLNISKRIAGLLGGTITLESEEGQGSVFTFSIPCIPAENSVSPDSSLSDDFNAYLDGKRILIVDDDNVQLMLMKELFAHYPAEVRTEINSPAVLALLEREHFDLVLTDIQMPVLDGFGLISLIRSHSDPKIATVPVIALSGRRDMSLKDFEDEGFTSHHPKPVQFEALLVLIAKTFGYEQATEMNNDKKTVDTADTPLYNLKSLSGFTNNDPESLKAILQTFIASAIDNCKVLQQAAINYDDKKLAETAHKMIPMLRQMEVHSIANLLMPLEDHTLNKEWPETQEYINKICERMTEFINELNIEMG